MPSSSNFNTRVFSPYVVLKQDSSRIAFTIKSGEGYTLNSGITVGSVIRFDPTITATGITGGYTLSQANSDVRAEVVGVVESVAGGAYTVVASGSVKYPESRLNQISGGGDGGIDVLFLSETVAGGLTGTIDISSGQEKIVKPVIQIAKHGEYNGIVTNYIGYKTGVEATVETTDQFFPLNNFSLAPSGFPANRLPKNWLLSGVSYNYTDYQSNYLSLRNEMSFARYELTTKNSYNNTTVNNHRDVNGSGYDSQNNEYSIVRLQVVMYAFSGQGDRNEKDQWVLIDTYEYGLFKYYDVNITTGSKLIFDIRLRGNEYSSPQSTLIHDGGDYSNNAVKGFDIFPEQLLGSRLNPFNLTNPNRKYQIYITFYSNDNQRINASDNTTANIDKRITLYDDYRDFSSVYNIIDKIVPLEFALETKIVTDTAGNQYTLAKKINNDSFVYKIPQQLTINDLVVEDVLKLKNSSGTEKTIDVDALCSNCSCCI